MNTLSLSFTIDTMLIDSEISEMVALRRLRAEQWIDLTRTDVMDTELGRRTDPAHRAQLRSLSGDLIEHIGPWILDHSRIGFCYVGSDQEAQEWDRLWQVMHPGKDRATADENDVRDALHVHTAKRYGANAFVTIDKKLLAKATAVRAAFNDFPIMTPARALAFAERMRRNYEFRRDNPLPPVGVPRRDERDF